MITFSVHQGRPAAGELVYRDDEFSFDTVPRLPGAVVSISLNELEIMLEEGTLRALFVTGYAPQSEWHLTNLDPPSAIPGNLVARPQVKLPDGTSTPIDDNVSRWPVFVDPAKRWVRMGRAPEAAEPAIWFAPGAVALLGKDGQLAELWLQPRALSIQLKR